MAEKTTRIELHDPDGHVYAYQRTEYDPFKWDVFIDGRKLPQASEHTDGRDVLWQMAMSIFEGLPVSGRLVETSKEKKK